MRDIFSYSLTDLLMFTSHTYERMFELYNRELWPAHLPIAVLVFWLMAVTRHSGVPHRTRLASLLLAFFWAAIAWRFFLQHYAAINLAAPWFALGFAVQAVLFAVVGAMAGRLQYAWSDSTIGRTGLALLLFAVLFVPFISVLLGRSWRGTDFFGATPDPTAIGTIGVLLMTQGKMRWLLLPIPILWCVISFLTYLAMVMKG